MTKGSFSLCLHIEAANTSKRINSHSQLLAINPFVLENVNNSTFLH